MNDDHTSLELRLLTLLHQAREEHDESARAALNALLRANAEARTLMPRLLVDEQALVSQLRDESIIALIAPTGSAKQALPRRATGRWYAWRPLTAAAAGIVFGMFCTSVVFGFVAQRAAVMKKMPLMIFDPSFEDANQVFEDGMPDRPGQWGTDSAKVVMAESAVKPLQGQCMMRLDPIPREKEVKNHTSRAYQVLDLRSLPSHDVNGDAEVQVTASFCGAKSDVSSRYLIRVLALDEAPEQALKDFWSKSESDGVVSESQRFDTTPGVVGWHTFSLKTRLPPGSKTLVFILGAVPPTDTAQKAFTHYLDEVQVSLITPQTTQP